MTFYISNTGQESFQTLHQQADDSVDMGAGAEAARLRNQRRQTVASESAVIATNIATSKSNKTPPVVITARVSSLGACTREENAISEDMRDKPTTNTDVDDEVSSITPAQESLAQTLKPTPTLKQEIDLLKKKVVNLTSGTANLKKQLDLKRDECDQYEKQIAQREETIAHRDKSIEEGRERYDAERLQSEKQGKRIRELREQKDKLYKSVEEANIDRVSADEKYQAEVKKREELETAIHKFEEERLKLQKEVESMKQNQNKFAKAAKSQMNVYETENNRLVAQCNRLVAQNSRRRTHVPAEDESKVVAAFFALQDGVRCWCLDVVDVVQAERQNVNLEFSKFPLGDREVRMTLHTGEVQFLVAYVWEWLMKSIFGSEQRKEQKVGQLFDLWLDEETARHLKFLEGRIASLQKSGVAHEWRSFTVQCLAENTNLEESSRTASVMEEASSWLLAVSNLEANESKEVVEKLLKDLQKDIVIPAISFSRMLRQRFTPILLKTPELLEDAVEDGYKLDFEHGEETPGVEIVIRPQLCKENLDSANGDIPKLEILVEAERFRQVDTNDLEEDETIRVVHAEDQEMSEA